ncbi:MAG: sigma 54-interacting transcriptional regulator [Pseudomonadota bacterium]
MDDHDGFAGDHLGTDGAFQQAAGASGSEASAATTAHNSDIGRNRFAVRDRFDMGASMGKTSLAGGDVGNADIGSSAVERLEDGKSIGYGADAVSEPTGATVLRPPQWSSSQTVFETTAPDAGGQAGAAARPAGGKSDKSRGRRAAAKSSNGKAARITRGVSGVHSGIDKTIVGSSAAAVALRDQITLYARSDQPVLISGETGVGKELVARHLHALGPRADRRFLPMNLSAMPDTMVAAALFGHEKGAYTGAHAERDGAFATANGGTLLLDEIGDLPVPLQTHLLRCLEDQMITRLGGFTATQMDVRLIAATNVDLAAAAVDGRFREDLYYRISILPIRVPPLRERGDDVIEIAEALIRGEAHERHRTAVLSPAAADRLRSYAFPGNVRELRSVLAQALVIACDGRGDAVIAPEDIRFAPLRAPAPLASEIDVSPSLSGAPMAAASCGGAAGEAAFEASEMNVRRANDLVSRWLTMRALNVAGGNVSRAAALSGRSRSTIHAFVNALEGADFAQEYQTLSAEVRSLLRHC